KPIIRVLFTERYIDAVHYERWYALFYLSMSIPFDAVARAIGDGAWIMRTTLIFAPLCVAATWVSIQYWGAMGALGALLSTQYMIRFYSLIYQKNHFGVSLARFLPLRSMALQTLLVAFVAVTSLMMHSLFSNEQMWF